MNSGSKKMKLLVTGASGFIGQEVSRQVSIGGYYPRLMIRQPGDDCEICHFDADFVQADLRDPESLKQAAKGIPAVAAESVNFDSPFMRRKKDLLQHREMSSFRPLIRQTKRIIYKMRPLARR